MDKPIIDETLQKSKEKSASKSKNKEKMTQDTEKAYRKYQLQWMLDHGYDLRDIMHRLAEIINNGLTYEGNAFVLLDEAFDIMENECGFKEGMMWAGYDEWLQNEYQQ